MWFRRAWTGIIKGKHPSMSVTSDSDMGINSWLEEELYQEYLHDRGAVDESWKQVFEKNAANGGNAPAPAATPAPQTAAPPAPAGEEVVPMRGAAARIAENMASSVTVPLATSQRIIPVKVNSGIDLMLEAGHALWSGKKFSPRIKPVSARGKNTITDILLENRK